MKGVFVDGLLELAASNPRFVFLTADLGFGMVEPLVEKFPKNFLNVGVAEQNMMGIAAGLGLDGRAVFTYSIGNFGTLRCLEQIRNDALYHDTNVTVVANGGGFSYGALGFSHHATEDLAIMRALPKISVVAPGCDWEAKEATVALGNMPGVKYLRLDKMSAGNTKRPGEVFQVGRARRLREGEDMTVVAIGGVLKHALAVADKLKNENIGVRVLSMHTLKPLDTAALLQAANETGGVITIEEHTVHGGLGGAAAELFMDAGVYPKVFRRMALRHGFSSIVGSQAYLQQCYGLDEKSLEKEVRLAIEGKQSTLTSGVKTQATETVPSQLS